MTVRQPFSISPNEDSTEISLDEKVLHQSLFFLIRTHDNREYIMLCPSFHAFQQFIPTVLKIVISQMYC